MELLSFLDEHWTLLTGFGIIIFSAVKFFLDMKALGKRVEILEDQLEENTEGDRDTQGKLLEIKASLKVLQTMIRSIAAKLDIPDLTKN